MVMTLRQTLLATIAAFLLSMGAASASGTDSFWRSCPAQRDWRYIGSGVILDVSWDLWRTLPGAEWSVEERQRWDWFEPDRLITAAAMVPGNVDPVDAKEYGPYYKWEHFAPIAQHGSTTAMTYGPAADLFHAGRWREAEAAFDVLANGASPLRAAAAYSAARAAIDAGDVDDGIRRVAALLADPADHEMDQAAHHLLGTMAYHTNAAPLLAARLAEISHLLMAPPELRCRVPALNQLAMEASGDLGYLLALAFPDDRMDDSDLGAPRRTVFTEVGRIDPVIDLARVLAIPSAFSDLIWKEPFYPEQAKVPGFRLDNQATLAAQAGYAAAAQAYARSRARETGNPLWGYALARLSSDPADLGLLSSAEAAALSGKEDVNDRRMLAAWLRAQRVRILLMSGQRDTAAALVQHDVLEPHLTRDLGPATEPSPADFVSQGGTRFLLASQDWAAARSWATATAASTDRGWTIPPREAEIAMTWKQLIGPGIRNRSVSPHGRRESMSDNVAAILDLLPADRLVDLARTPDLAMDWKRPLLGAAWIRYYALGREDAFERLFPEVRATFPETTADLDAIQGAWLSVSRHRLIARMLLRLPGLSPRVLWNRDVSYYGEGRTPTSLFSIVADHNDGNWWCPVDPARARRDAFGGSTPDLTGDWSAEKQLFSTFWTTGDIPDGTEPIDRLALTWLHDRPLTHDLDYAELEALSHVPSGPKRLADEAVRWAGWSNVFTRWLGFDRDLPETLALAVRATRYGCATADPLGPASHAAWTALHKTFSQSEWARRTPYWFDETQKPELN